MQGNTRERRRRGRRRSGAILAVAAISLSLGACGWFGSENGKQAKSLPRPTVARIKKLMATPPFDRGVWGLLVTDLDTGRELYGLNLRKQFQAASTTKNFTTSAVLNNLGQGYRFHTPVVRLGSVSTAGTLSGDLVLQAAGDLTMGGRALPGDRVAYTGFDHTDANEVPGPTTLTPQDPLAGVNRLARQVAANGIRRVTGDVVIDDRLWRQRRVGHDEISPIVINDNEIDIMMTPTNPGELVRATTRPATKAYSIDVRVRTGPPGGPTNVEVGQAVGGRVVVKGTIAAGTKPTPFVQVFRVPKPAFFARSLFVEALRRAGVEVDAPTVAPNATRRLPPRSVVASRPRVALLTSPRVSEFVKLILKVSHNPGANTAPFWLGVKAGKPTFAAGMNEIRAFAAHAGVDPHQITLIDGQGGPGNKISPAAQVQLLRYIARQPYAKAFRAALPVKGVDGLPVHPERDPATGHVSNKNGVNGALDASGRLEVQAMALAGYVDAKGKGLAFDLVVNHFPILGPNGRPSQDPEAAAQAFQNFGPLEGITTQLYLSQR